MKIPAHTRLYAIGDIHGRYDLLTLLLRLIRQEAASYSTARKILVTLGDYIDRGPGARRVIDTFLHLPIDGFETRHLKGNHEKMLLDFMEDPEQGSVWLSNGGWATLLSYGFRASDLPKNARELPRLRDCLLKKIPQAHWDFFKSLHLFYQLGDYYFVHAGVHPGVALESQTEDDLLWIREPFLSSEYDWGKIIVHGHSITHQPRKRFNRIGLDTGAFHTGVLTCLVLQGEEHHFLQVREETSSTM
ncbi:MAG: serine/threonine protein phosphatase [Coxiella sp. RIFCSPHIGHO2_12_FULL_44_14]|nr:MAG: serine/threonine protein phosphatase [Coxiella sp. RIFCSPHIGHO2_12_FULL_44_14]